MAAGLAVAVAGLGVTGTGAQAQTGVWTYDSQGDPYWTPGSPVGRNVAQQRTVLAQRYVPTIWVDPDGCEHWVMDDGVEGYMTPHVTRDGRPVCNRGQPCGIINSDQLFATDRYNINADGQARLRSFFQQSSATAYIIEGHTDWRASDEYNMVLSHRRAASVAAVARSVGARVVAVRGYGERNPRAPNTTAAGMQQNRRVEITCIR